MDAVTSPDEWERLLRSVRSMFDAQQQVRHYEHGATEGPTNAERWLLAMLPGRGRVLDLGCGAGRVTITLARQGYDIVGADISPGLLQYAHMRCQGQSFNAHFVLIDPLRLPFSHASFDAILAFKIYCYIPTRAARLQYLATVGSFLRPGASLLLTQYVVPDEHFLSYRDDQHKRVAAAYSSLDPGDTFTIDEEAYVHWFTACQLREELEASGLSLVEFCNDRDFNGGGFIQLAVLAPPSPHRSTVNQGDLT